MRPLVGMVPYSKEECDAGKAGTKKLAAILEKKFAEDSELSYIAGGKEASLADVFISVPIWRACQFVSFSLEDL